MNSWNQHVPKLVAAIGFLLLAYSMTTFFRTPSSHVPPAVAPHTPPKSGLPQPAAKPATKYVGKTWDKSAAPVQGRAAKDQGAALKLARQMEAEARTKRAKNYLKNFGIKMHLPEDMDFVEAKNEGMTILIGTRGGKPDFYLASGKEKMTPAQAKAEMQDQFEGSYGLKNIDTSTTTNKNGLGPITQFKGSTRTGEEFQAYYFYNSKSGNSHMLFIADKDLSRQPARTRQLVDSLEYAR